MTHDLNRCGRPRFTEDYRQDNDFIPPVTEHRTRCLNCGWQGPWHRVEEAPHD